MLISTETPFQMHVFFLFSVFTLARENNIQIYGFLIELSLFTMPVSNNNNNKVSSKKIGQWFIAFSYTFASIARAEI